jgi:hypothetical protein
MRPRSATLLVALFLVGCSKGAPPPESKPVNVPVVESPKPADAGTQSSSGSPVIEPVKRERPWILQKKVTGALLPGDVKNEVLLYQREPDKGFPWQWRGEMKLEVRDEGPSGRSLSEVILDGNKVIGLDLVEFRPGQPVILVRYRQEAVSDHTAVAAAYTWVDGRLTLAGSLSGWMGAASLLQGAAGPEVEVTSRWTPPHSREYSLIEHLDTKPAPKLIRRERLGWQDGKVVVVSTTISRLAYSLYEEKK